MITIGKEIQRLRNHFGKTQQQIADEVGCKVEKIKYYEAIKKIPQLEFYNRILECFGYEIEIRFKRKR